MRHESFFLIASFFIALLLYGQQGPAPLRLTMRDAIAMGLKANLGVQVAGTQVSEASGTLERQRSVLLPHVTADHQTSFQNRNLQAFGLSAQALGLSIPGLTFPVTVGPFSNYDYRISASQTVLDFQAKHTVRAGDHQQQSARLTYQDARDQVVRQAAGLYLSAQSAAAQVESAEARVTTSQALVQLAEDQHKNGLATAVDVLRAQVQLRRDEQSLLADRNAYQTSLLSLTRYLGISPGTPIGIADHLSLYEPKTPGIAEALPAALKARSDYLSLRSQREALIEQQKASRARYLPRLTIDGNYGVLGRSYGTMPGIGAIEATLAVTVFDHDREGEQKELASRIERINDQIADYERGIEQDLRKALLDLDTTRQQVSVTQSALELSQRELELAKDRFKNGLTDNLEVVTAQSSLQGAQDDYILSLAQHEDALMSLIRAMGASEQSYQRFLGEGSISPDNVSPDKKEVRP